MDQDSVLKTYVMTEVNGHIATIAASQDAGEPEWQFYCECGQADCHEQVMLTLREYDALHEVRRPVLAPGHYLDQAERARRLLDEAEALRAQAEQQVRRAQQNLGLTDDPSAEPASEV